MRVQAKYEIRSTREDVLQSYSSELISESLFYRFADECKKVLTISTEQHDRFSGEYNKVFTVQGIVLSPDTYCKITELLKTCLTFDQYMKVLNLLTTE